MPEQGADRDEAVLVVIPTYNERETLRLLVQRLRSAAPQADALVVDDASPDGTGQLAEQLADGDEQVHVLHRARKAGLGPAYIAGFRWALDRSYDIVVEMDADGSHPPERLPALLAATAHADLVIGSRYVPGGRVVNWPKRRALLSKGANRYARVALGTAINDITAGYRAYRAAVLERLPLDRVESAGYCFQVDLAWRAAREGYRVREVPITFTERQYGQSKMSGNVVLEAMFKVGRWGLRHRAGQLRALVTGTRRTTAAPARRGRSPRD